MDYLELFNKLIKVAKPVNANNAKAESLDQSLADTGLDSLDFLMMGIYLSDIYGVPEEIAKEVKGTTPMEFIQFFIDRKTKSPESVDSAIKSVS